MGDSFQKLVDTDATADETEGLAWHILDHLIGRGVVQPEPSVCALGGESYAPGPNADDVIVPPAQGFQALAVNGMRIIAERTVFFGWGDFDLICTV